LNWKELRVSLEPFLDGCGRLPFGREDLLDETMLRLLVASRSREIRCPEAYARTILRNAIRDRLRELELAKAALDELAKEVCREDGSSGAMEDAELVAHLLEHARLSPIQEKVIRMLYLEEMKNSDVARELGKNPGTIQRHRDRALEKLLRCAIELGVCP
jgi:RNA polymerase sigma factor (sigma-70 family)